MENFKINFWEYYQNLTERVKKRELRKKILAATQTEQATFYTWNSNQSIPKWQIERVGYVVSAFIAEQMNISEENIVVSFDKTEK